MQMSTDCRNTRFYENFNLMRFDGCGKYDMPTLEKQDYVSCEFVGFNYAKTAKNKEEKGIHFFLDDYQFERLWRDPGLYSRVLFDFKCVLTPDFSMYTDYPKALQMYNHYRKQWLGAYWQSLGLTVIPTVAWSDKDSFDWCFDGIPKNATVAVSSVGTQIKSETKRLFLDGWTEMLNRLEPETVIFYGQVPEECSANIVRIKAYQEKFREVLLNGWQR